jgi:serine phosphatase RsbU (regulator of sigma subunit)
VDRGGIRVCRYRATGSLEAVTGSGATDGGDRSGSAAAIALLEAALALPPHALVDVVDLAGAALGASSARMLIADYGLISLQELGDAGPTGPRQTIQGSLPGRAFARDEIVLSNDDRSLVWVPLAEGSERLGVLELTHPTWDDDVQAMLDPIVHVLVLLLVSKRRYTDVVLRGRRTEPLSFAAEMQWDLLPPLTCSADRVSVSGILEPAYSIGGDSFDYAVNPGRLEFAIVDAVGRGTSAVMLSVAVITSLRNARREGIGAEGAYHSAGAVIETQFGRSAFVTAQFGSIELDTGVLTWVNAGHPPPLLVRNGSYVGELACRASMPVGLGGSVVEIAAERLQPGDRVLFFTDGVVETRSSDSQRFGVPRLADLLVRSTLDEVSPAETVRRLSALITERDVVRTDDATLLLIEYHGSQATG